MITKAFADVLRQERQKVGWSQEELGFRTGLHRTYISQIERGIKNPTLTTVNRIADALGIGLTDLVQKVEVRMRSDAANGTTDG